MIILLFFSPFFIAIFVLFYIDSSNESQIIKFYKNNSCSKIYYYKSVHKSLCEKDILLINNQFNIDFETNINIRYQNIIEIKKKKLNLEIKTDKKSYILDFETKDEVKNFKKDLEKKISKF